MNARTSSINRVTWVGFFVNLALTILKLTAGVVGNSGAMIADAIHSLSDFATDIVVLASFRMVKKPADQHHRYGYGKYETLATAVIGAALLFVGIGIFWSGVTKVWLILRGEPLAQPGVIALIAAVISIVVKEALYRHTARVGKRYYSQTLIANAWHHRSDALSSIGVLVGVSGAIALGESWRVLDPIAAIVVSFFIIKTAIQISSGSIRELCEESLDSEIESEILQLALAGGSAKDAHNLRTRRIGNEIAIELHVRVNPEMCVADAHTIASNIEQRLREHFGASTFVSIHVEPLLPAIQPKTLEQ